MSEVLPIRRRLLLLTVLGAVGGALFAPFVLSNPAADPPAAPVVWAIFTVGSAVATALAAWGGLRWGDRAGLPMPILRRWEVGPAAGPVDVRRAVVVPLALGGILGVLAVAAAAAADVPENPGSLWVRLATTPFAAVVPEALVHLLGMSGLVLLTRRTGVAILLSAIAFVLLFHGNPPAGAPLVTAFVVGLNFALGALTGWIYARRGYAGAMLAHAAAHAIVMGAN